MADREAEVSSEDLLRQAWDQLRNEPGVPASSEIPASAVPDDTSPTVEEPAGEDLRAAGGDTRISPTSRAAPTTSQQRDRPPPPPSYRSPPPSHEPPRLAPAEGRPRSRRGWFVLAAIAGFLILRFGAGGLEALIGQPNGSGTDSEATAEDPIGNAAVSYESFTTVEGMNLSGSARHVDQAISLTRKNEAMQAGAAWFAERQPVVDGFETTFLFEIDHVARWTIGDGFAFVIQNAGPTAVGEGADGIGYKKIPHSLAVEFDTVYHDYADDPQTPISGNQELIYSANHVAVHTMGTEPNTSHSRAMLDYAALDPVFLYDRQPHVALIRYQPGELSIYVDDFDEPVLVVPMDLGQTLALNDGHAFVGFTAGAAGFYADHKIHGWALNSPCLIEGCQSP